jgi:hypothetical protein
MNTFIVKYHSSLKGGKFIGKSLDEVELIYAFRSHKVFKDSNPGIQNCAYTIIEGEDLHKEFDFKKNNVCPCCGGLGKFYQLTQDKPMNGNIIYDEDGFAQFDDVVAVYCVCDDGTYIGYQESKLRQLQNNLERVGKDLQDLVSWIAETSTCKTCKGNQRATPGGCHCEECGLVGTAPWGG